MENKESKSTHEICSACADNIGTEWHEPCGTCGEKWGFEPTRKKTRLSFFLPENPNREQIDFWYEEYQRQLDDYKQQQADLSQLGIWLQKGPQLSLHEIFLPVILYASVNSSRLPDGRLYALLVKFEWVNFKEKVLYKQNLRYISTLCVFENQKEVDLTKSTDELYSDYKQQKNLPLSLTFDSLSMALTKMCIRDDAPYKVKGIKKYIPGFRGWRLLANDQMLQSLVQKDTTFVEHY